MDNILDNSPSPQNEKRFFSNASFGLAIFSLVSLIMHALELEQTFGDIEFSFELPSWLFGLTNGTIIVGVLASALSFIKKEPSSFSKWAGTVLNSIYVLLFLASHLL